MPATDAREIVGRLINATFDRSRLRMNLFVASEGEPLKVVMCHVSLTGFDQMQQATFGDGPFWLGAARKWRMRFHINGRDHMYAYDVLGSVP